LKQPALERVIIFGAMKHSVEKLSQELNRAGFKADAIHGNKSHGQRQRSLTNFKTGRVNILVATDVAARGIHVDNVTHVINYDLPNTFEDYVHRIGRTGRADKLGTALTFVAK
jgi:superfamily II DNA/RNA helicase